MFRYEFERTNPFYRDALVGPEYEGLDQAELDAEADRRHDAFKAVLAAAAVPQPASPLDDARDALTAVQVAVDALSDVVDSAVAKRLSGPLTVTAIRDVLPSVVAAVSDAFDAVDAVDAGLVPDPVGS